MSGPDAQPQPAAEQDTAIIRMRLALMMAREWGGMGGGWHGLVAKVLRDWIDAGMTGPIPWPRSAMFEEWAAEKGISNVDGYVGFRVTMRLSQ